MEHDKILPCDNNNNKKIISWRHGNKPAVKEGEKYFLIFTEAATFFSLKNTLLHQHLM